MVIQHLARLQPTPHAVFLVLQHDDGRVHAGESHVRTVILAVHDPVHLLVVDAGDLVGALRVLPKPLLPLGLDGVLLLARCFGFLLQQQCGCRPVRVFDDLLDHGTAPHHGELE